MKKRIKNLLGFAWLSSVSGAAFAAIMVNVTVNPGNPVLEGTNGSVQFSFTNTGAASRIGGAATVVFPQMGDPTDFVTFGRLDYGGCDPFGNNNLGSCTMTQPFVTDTPIPNEPVDSGTRIIRGGILLANGQMAFGQAQVTVNDAALPPPPPPALLIQPDFANVIEGGSGILHFTVTNTGGSNATIAQVNTDTWFFFGNDTDDSGILNATGCAPGTVLSPNGSCTVSIPFFTPFTVPPPEDFDFGVTAVDLNVVLTTGNSSFGTGGVLVDDVVPEPATMLLVGIGTLGMILWRRTRKSVR